MAKKEVSAGGVVFKKDSKGVLVLLCQHSGHHGWVFPKGIIGDHTPGENEEETALREVEEETGIKGKILKKLPPITYFYKINQQTIHKTVHYFLMEFVSGDINRHDHEMEDVEWLPLEKVEKRLSYKSDKEIFGFARKELLG